MINVTKFARKGAETSSDLGLSDVKVLAFHFVCCSHSSDKQLSIRLSFYLCQLIKWPSFQSPQQPVELLVFLSESSPLKGLDTLSYATLGQKQFPLIKFPQFLTFSSASQFFAHCLPSSSLLPSAYPGAWHRYTATKCWLKANTISVHSPFYPPPPPTHTCHPQHSPECCVWPLLLHFPLSDKSMISIVQETRGSQGRAENQFPQPVSTSELAHPTFPHFPYC